MKKCFQLLVAFIFSIIPLNADLFVTTPIPESQKFQTIRSYAIGRLQDKYIPNAEKQSGATIRAFNEINPAALHFTSITVDDLPPRQEAILEAELQRLVRKIKEKTQVQVPKETLISLHNKLISIDQRIQTNNLQEIDPSFLTTFAQELDHLADSIAQQKKDNSFAINVNHLELFGNSITAEMRTPSWFTPLIQETYTRLANNGIEDKFSQFIPHVTIARVANKNWLTSPRSDGKPGLSIGQKFAEAFKDQLTQYNSNRAHDLHVLQRSKQKLAEQFEQIKKELERIEDQMNSKIYEFQPTQMMLSSKTTTNQQPVIETLKSFAL